MLVLKCIGNYGNQRIMQQIEENNENRPESYSVQGFKAPKNSKKVVFTALTGTALTIVIFSALLIEFEKSNCSSTANQLAGTSFGEGIRPDDLDFDSPIPEIESAAQIERERQPVKPSRTERLLKHSPNIAEARVLVLDLDGNPIRDARVSLIHEPSIDMQTAMGFQSSAGRLVLHNPTDEGGVANFEVDSDILETYSDSSALSFDVEVVQEGYIVNRGERLVVDLAQKQRFETTVYLEPGVYLNGRVYDSKTSTSISGAHLCFSFDLGAGKSTSFYGETLEDGSFALINAQESGLSGVPKNAESMTLSVEHPNYEYKELVYELPRSSIEVSLTPVQGFDFLFVDKDTGQAIIQDDSTFNSMRLRVCLDRLGVCLYSGKDMQDSDLNWATCRLPFNIELLTDLAIVVPGYRPRRISTASLVKHRDAGASAFTVEVEAAPSLSVEFVDFHSNEPVEDIEFKLELEAFSIALGDIVYEVTDRVRFPAKESGIHSFCSSFSEFSLDLADIPIRAKLCEVYCDGDLVEMFVDNRADSDAIDKLPLFDIEKASQVNLFTTVYVKKL